MPLKRGKKAALARIRANAWYVANRTRAKRRIAQWQKDNPQKVKANRRFHRKKILAGQRRAYRARVEYYKACSKKWAETHQTERRAIGRRWARKKRFHQLSISKVFRDELMRLQKRRCAICFSKAKLCLDHDHVTGFFRGLLCHKCNIGLGSFRDNPEFLRTAARFLEAMR